MARIFEKDLILPLLYIINKEPIKTSKLIDVLREVMKPCGDDLIINKNRNDDKFSQIVRNLVSHYTPDKPYYSFYDRSFHITDLGRKYLGERIDAVESIFQNSLPNKEALEIIHMSSPSSGKHLLIADENAVVKEGAPNNRTQTIRDRSRRLREAAIEAFRAKENSIHCCVCNFDFSKKYGQIGTDFIEVHHEKPIAFYTSDDESQVISAALANLKLLCSNCHRMIHRNRTELMSVEELKKLLVP